MSGFQVPFTSSPPSTPDTRPRQSNKHNPFVSMASNPSTTPAGPPPPSSARSFTPDGPPPSSGSSSPDFGADDTFDSSTSNRFAAAARTKNGTPASRTYAVPETPFSSSPLAAGSDGDDEEDPMVEDQFMEDDEGEGEDKEVDADADNEKAANRYEGDTMDEDEFRPSPSGSLRSLSGESQNGLEDLIRQDTPRGTKRSRGGGAVGLIRQYSEPASTEPPSNHSPIPSIVKDLAAGLGSAEVYESDEIILGTEALVPQLYNRHPSTHHDDAVVKAALSTIPEELIKLWHSDQDSNPSEYGGLEGSIISIGPEESASPIAKATFISSLLLRLHHPPNPRTDSSLNQSRSKHFSASTTTTFASSQATGRPLMMPKVLLDWLDTYHNPYPTATVDLQRHHPNPTAHANFWDIIFASTLRGKILEIIRILREADFKHAESALEDGSDGPGYHGVQLGNVHRVINRAIQVLENCPALHGGGWDIRGNDWRLYRRKIDQAVTDLATFAEGGDKDREKMVEPLAADNFNLPGTSNATLSLSRASRRAESKVPWTIYQNLKIMYGMLSGGTAEISSVAQDWVEATIGLTVWWDGEDDLNFMASRRSLGRTQSRNLRPVDIDPIAAYLQRLGDSFRKVTKVTKEPSSSDFQINPMNAVEVGLASVFEGNVEGVIDLLRCWSLTITTAVVEVAGIGSWLPMLGGGKFINGFDESDLMVLSYNPSQKRNVDRDDILMEYTEGLFNREELRGTHNEDVRKGWELAVQVLGRLDNVELANKKVGELLDLLQLSSSELVDTLLNLCNELGLSDQARRISEKYADSITEGSYSYGVALLYYARAHNAKKVKNVLDLLVSLCLVQSIAYPPESDVDEHLKQLISSPKQTLNQLSQIDSKAAELLHTYLSGYATLRRFYSLRDEDVTTNSGETSGLRPIARKKAAVSALIAVINSAEDNIHGGLYDENRGAIVQVDGLLALLGEAMVFVDQPDPMLTLSQTFSLLKAIEDIQTAPSRVYGICNDCFNSTLASYHGTQPHTSPRAMLKKSLSSMTSSSGFSLIDMSGSGQSSFKESKGKSNGGGRSIGSSGVLVGAGGKEVKRGWDWRKGIGRQGNAEDVLRILRLGLAKELARLWIDG
ncbi:MAG: hypothetical protein M1812_003555 [Candelaria pacifica]|nr:MAG: hypothetical protein M1812_003555 [Candelaria pacifica]